MPEYRFAILKKHNWSEKELTQQPVDPNKSSSTIMTFENVKITCVNPDDMYIICEIFFTSKIE
jgi:hypothetical protein